MTSPRIEALRKLLAGRPDDLRIQYGLAVELLREGYREEGVERLTRYLDAGTDEGAGWALLAETLRDSGAEIEARAALHAGIAAAEAHHHPTLAEELRESLAGEE